VNFLAFVAQEWLLVSLLGAFIAVYFFSERIKSGLPISTHELTTLVNSEQAVIVDLRPNTEFKQGHLVDAINIPYEKIDSDIASLEKYKTKTIILIDKMGQHAGSIGNKLKKQGFDIRRLSGGISEWQAQNLPLIKTK
jgi:rhodanese-related sulfurtransferase